MEEAIKELIEEMRTLRESIDTLNKNLNQMPPISNTKQNIPRNNGEIVIPTLVNSPIVQTVSQSEYFPIKLYGKIEEKNNSFVYTFARNVTQFQFKDIPSKAASLEKCKAHQIKESLTNPRNNRYAIKDSTVYLELCNGTLSTTIFDLVDLQLISDHVWYFHKGYAITRMNDKRIKMSEILSEKSEDKKSISEVANFPKGKSILHTNGNLLDNRRSNLSNGASVSSDQLFSEVAKDRWAILKEQAKKEELQMELVISYIDTLADQYPTFPLREYAEFDLIEDYKTIIFSNIQTLTAAGKGHNVSFKFMREAMLKATRSGYPTIEEVWKRKERRKKLWEVMIVLDMPALSKPCLFQAFTLKCYRVTNFPPLVARNLYDYYFLPDVDNKRVLDFCSGYGGRFMGFYASKTCSEYVGIDPNSYLSEPYKNLEAWITKNFNNPNKVVTFIKECAEDVDYSKLGKFDIIFTSPPYFNLEIYSDDKKQSCHRYPELSIWRDKFLFASINKVIPVLKNGGIIAINIKNSKKWDIDICEEMSEFIKSKGLKQLETLSLPLAKRPSINKDSSEPIFVFQKV